jgi:IS4 transposase
VKRRFRDEYEGADLGDARRSERLAELGMALAAFPADSFPEVLGDGGELEAAYRFLSNPAVEPAEVLAPHIRETAARCAVQGDCVVAHDTTDFVFPGTKRRGLGRMRGCVESGFFAHVAMGISLDEIRDPLGVLHLETWVRGPKVKKGPKARQRDGDRESTRWLRGIEAVEGHVGKARAIHVMDREADAYDLMSDLVEHQRRFVLRSTFDRRLVDGEYLIDSVEARPVVVTREVPLSERKRAQFPVQQRIHPPRTARAATLGIKAATVTLLRPKNLLTDQPRTLRINVVVVDEIDVPAGEPPVGWRLFTTEPIETPTQIERIVDAYRCRWRIEELFKALKTGCAIEKRQLESYRGLTNALAIYIPIAWRVLRHRTLAHAAGDRPATLVLSPLQLRILRRVSRAKLSRSPTLAEALIAVASVGGHLKRNGPPGWQTLARGYERLLTLEEGVALGAEM